MTLEDIFTIVGIYILGAVCFIYIALYHIEKEKVKKLKARYELEEGKRKAKTNKPTAVKVPIICGKGEPSPKAIEAKKPIKTPLSKAMTILMRVLAIAKRESNSAK
jgi:hypothetical protein